EQEIPDSGGRRVDGDSIFEVHTLIPDRSSPGGYHGAPGSWCQGSPSARSAAARRPMLPRPRRLRRDPAVTLARRPRPCHTATIIGWDVGRVARTPPRREGGGIRVSALAARVMVAGSMVACAVLLLACSSTPARESAPAQSGPAPAAGAAAG